MRLKNALLNTAAGAGGEPEVVGLDAEEREAIARLTARYPVAMQGYHQRTADDSDLARRANKGDAEAGNALADRAASFTAGAKPANPNRDAELRALLNSMTPAERAAWEGRKGTSAPAASAPQPTQSASGTRVQFCCGKVVTFTAEDRKALRGA